MMPVNFHKEVDYVARLARLTLEPAEKERMAGQLSDILQTACRIQELDTTGIEPTSHVLDLPVALRDDVNRPSLSLDRVLQNAPRQEKNYIRVPRITGSGHNDQ